MLLREGWVPVLGVFALATGTAVWVGPLWSMPLWLLLAVAAVTFTETRREIPAVPLAVLSPADATVTAVDYGHDPWLQRDALVIRLQLGAPGIQGLRSPVEGKVMDFFTNLGNADAPAQSPTAYTQWIQTDEDEDVVSCFSTMRYSRFKSAVAPGERVGHGSRSGFVYFGTEAVVYAPAGSHVEVEPGDVVLAGVGIIAMLVRPANGQLAQE